MAEDRSKYSCTVLVGRRECILNIVDCTLKLQKQVFSCLIFDSIVEYSKLGVMTRAVHSGRSLSPTPKQRWNRARILFRARTCTNDFDTTINTIASVN